MSPIPVLNNRCFNHADREAALLCKGCGRPYCRECASEHDGRFLCAACLGGVAAQDTSLPTGKPITTQVLMLVGVMALMWGFFYQVGNLILAVPVESQDRQTYFAPGEPD